MGMYTEHMIIDPFLASWTQFSFSNPTLKIAASHGLSTFMPSSHTRKSPTTSMFYETLALRYLGNNSALEYTQEQSHGSKLPVTLVEQ